jgi:hypothetical protein
LLTEQAEEAEESLSLKFVFAFFVAIPGRGRAVKSACPMGKVLFTDPPQLGGKVAGVPSHPSGAVCAKTQPKTAVNTKIVFMASVC